MERVRDCEKTNGCFATVGRHPILLSIHAGSLLFVSIFLLQSGPDNPILQAALTFGSLLKLWLTTVLTLFGVLLAGIFPGLMIEMTAVVILGEQLLSPLLASAYSGNHDDTIPAALFVRILALLLTGVLAGASSLQITRRWAEILAIQMDPDGENPVPDELLPTLSDWKDLFRLLVRRFFRVVLPLSVLIVGSTVWIM